MKILVIDIETAPLIGYAWNTWNTNIIKVIHPTRMLCFAAKWAGESKMVYYSEAKHGREKMVRKVHELLDEADAVVHYNGESFDVPHINRECALLGLNPPAGFVHIDLLRTVRKRFKFDQNRLKDITAAFGIEEKAQHEGFGLWEKCLAGDKAAWKEMEGYNRQDVVATESLYDRIRSWIPGHPSLRLYDGVAGCPTCGSDHLQRRGYAYTRVSKYVKYQCQACGGYFRESRRQSGVSVQQVAAS